MNIKCNNFVKRQTADSQFSHFDPSSELGPNMDSWAVLERLAAFHFENQRRGHKDGIVLVMPPAFGFFCGVGVVTDPELLTVIYKARVPGEDPYLQVCSKGQKQPAKHVELVLYSHETLGKDASTDADWEIVSVNARLSEAPEPMHPVTMARNFLNRTGGTPAKYTAEEFAQAIEFWSNHVMVAPK